MGSRGAGKGRKMRTPLSYPNLILPILPILLAGAARWGKIGKMGKVGLGKMGLVRITSVLHRGM